MNKINLDKVYNCMEIKILWQVLRMYGIYIWEALLISIKGFYVRSSASVRTND